MPDRQASIPNSRQIPSELCLDLDGAYAFDSFHNSDPHSSSVYIPDYIFGNIRPGLDQVFFNNCPASLVGDVTTPESGQMLNMNLASQSAGYSTSLSRCFPIGTLSPQASICFMPTQIIHGVNDKAWPWLYAEKSLNNLFTQSNLVLLNLEPLIMERYKQSPINGYEIQGPSTSGYFHASHEITVRETKRQAISSDSGAGNSVRPTVKCDYHSCNKTFTRNDSLKRHRRM